MTNIQQIVNTFLNQRPDIRLSMGNDLINKSALAKYIIKKKKLSSNMDAVVSAIRRYDLKSADDVYFNAKKILTEIADISTRTKMVIVTLGKEIEIMNLIPKLYALIDHEKGELLRVVHANQYLKIIINKNNLEKLKEIIPDEKINSIVSLSEINIRFKRVADNIPGPISILINELAINKVSIIEMITCFPEVIIYTFEKDLITGFHALQQLSIQDCK